MSAPPRGGRGGWRHRDHTRGSLLGSLAVLALPLLATSGAAVTFQLLDLAMVSRLGEDATTAVIVSNQSIRQVIFMLVLGASFGAQALIARHVGQADPERAARATGQVLVLGLGISAGVAALGLLFAEPLLRGMNVAPAVLEAGVPYLRLVLLLGFGFVFAMLVNGVLNGAGDSTTPMLLTVVQTAISLGAEWLLIFGHAGLPALGVRGAAFGVALGQAVSIALAFWILLGGGTRVHLRLRHLRPDPAVLLGIVRLAWPPALQMIGGFLVTIFFLRLVGEFGPKAQAAYSIGLRLGMVGPMLAFPLAGAAATLVGQNLGAGRVRRAWASFGVGLAVHAAVLWSVAAGLFLFRTGIVAAFADDPEVIRLGASLLRYQAGAFAAFGLYFVFLRGLQGAGDVLVPMLLSLGNAVGFTLPLGVWLATDAGLGRGPEGVFLAQMIGAIAVTALTGAWLATGRWTRRAPPRARSEGAGLDVPAGG